jgi:hypothetical protein
MSLRPKVCWPLAECITHTARFGKRERPRDCSTETGLQTIDLARDPRVILYVDVRLDVEVPDLRMRLCFRIPLGPQPPPLHAFEISSTPDASLPVRPFLDRAAELGGFLRARNEDLGAGAVRLRLRSNAGPAAVRGVLLYHSWRRLEIRKPVSWGRLTITTIMEGLTCKVPVA